MAGRAERGRRAGGAEARLPGGTGKRLALVRGLSAPIRGLAPVRGLLAPVRGWLVAAVALQAVASAAALVSLVAIAHLGTLLLANGGASDSAVWGTVGIAAAATVASLLAASAASGLSHLADAALQLRLRRRLAQRLGALPLGWFAGRSSGQVKKLVHDDVATMHYLVAHTALDLTAVVVTPVAAVAYLATVDWRLAALTLLPVAAGTLLFARAMAGAGTKMAAYGRAANEINNGAVEFVDGIAVLKTFHRERAAHQRFTQAAQAFYEFFSGWVRSTTGITTASQLAVAPAVVLLLLLGAGVAMVAGGALAAVDLLPFALLAPAVAAPVGAIGRQVQALRTGQAAATAITELLHEPDPPRPAVPLPQRPADATVVLRGVGFSYDGTRPVLAGIDLTLTPGTVTALVGPSGAGKSTLAQLLPRLLDPTDGIITLGGVDLRELDATTRYRTVGFVFQEVALLRASLADNIALGRPDAERAAVEQAAVAAQIHDRIATLPRGYDTVVGSEVELSGGEAQRVSIARALLADPPVLVLDEATAYADPDSEAQIQQALSAAAAGRTVLVVAHRLTTIRHADQIVVLDGGRIVERGRHDELLAAAGRYARMWRAQAAGDDVLSGTSGGGR